MIDISEIRNVIRARIYNSGIIDIDCFAWENKVFDPANKDLWISELYLPATGGFSDSVRTDFESGIFQFNINTPINSPSGDTIANSTAKQIADLFTTPETIHGDNTKASIVVTKSFQGKLDDLWYTSIIDINYNCYSK